MIGLLVQNCHANVSNKVKIFPRHRGYTLWFTFIDELYTINARRKNYTELYVIYTAQICEETSSHRSESYLHLYYSKVIGRGINPCRGRGIKLKRELKDLLVVSNLLGATKQWIGARISLHNVYDYTGQRCSPVSGQKVTFLCKIGKSGRGEGREIWYQLQSLSRNWINSEIVVEGWGQFEGSGKGTSIRIISVLIW